jgi:hypothetical protein
VNDSGSSVVFDDDTKPASNPGEAILDSVEPYVVGSDCSGTKDLASCWARIKRVAHQLAHAPGCFSVRVLDEVRVHVERDRRAGVTEPPGNRTDVDVARRPAVDVSGGSPSPPTGAPRPSPGRLRDHLCLARPLEALRSQGTTR